MSVVPEKILVLEDDRGLRVELVEVLRDEDYEVEGAASARDAITMAKFSPFALLLTDVRLGGEMDGISAVEEIKKLRPSIYTIVLTGYADDLVPSRAMRQGVDFYLYKNERDHPSFQPGLETAPGFTIRKILNAVRMVLDTQKYCSTYQGKLERFFRGARKFVSSVSKQATSEEVNLDILRYRVFKSIYIGIQSGNLVLPTVQALWDRLTPLELEYEALAQIAGPEADALASRYFLVQEEVEAYAQARKRVEPATRKPGQIGREQIGVIYDRIAWGQIDVSRFLGGPILWEAAKGRRPSDQGMAEIWDLLFVK